MPGSLAIVGSGLSSWQWVVSCPTEGSQKEQVGVLSWRLGVKFQVVD